MPNEIIDTHGGYAGPAPEPKAQEFDPMLNSPPAVPGSVGYDPGTVQFTEGAAPVTAFPQANPPQAAPDPQRQMQTAPAPGFQETPPPAAPAATDRVSALEGQVGELIRQLGEEREVAEQRQRQMEINYAAQMAAVNQQGGGGGAAPDNDWDPEQPMTKGDFVTASQNLLGLQQSLTLRTIHNIQPDEEQAALQANPTLNQLPEPQKTQYLVQDVERARAKKGKGRPTGPRSTSAPGASATPPTHVVPHVEGRVAPSAPDLGPRNVENEIATEYERAKAIQDPQERLRAMRAVMDKGVAAAGMTPQQFTRGGFTVKE